MNDSSESTTPWTLIFHALPPKPDYFRVKIRRRLHQLGAVPLKNSVYALPSNDQSIEDFEWLAQEIRRDGGEAIVVQARFISGVSDPELESTFNTLRAVEYKEIVGQAREALSLDPGPAQVVVARLKRRLSDVATRDTFGAPERSDAESAIDELSRQIGLTAGAPATEHPPAGTTWITRQGVFVDRIASAWLIRRFIDRKARFKFVPPTGYQPLAGEVRFDMFEGEYGHRGDQCTFETLADVFGLADDPGVRHVAEVVHDLDLRDDKFARPEASGILALLQGITARYASDAERIEQGRRLFDQLYSHFSRQP